MDDRILAETWMIRTTDPDIQVCVGNKRLAQHSAFAARGIVLFVHGATYPSEAVFDVDVGSGSWVESLARHGYDVYWVDVRGYGGSTRPPSMAAPAGDNPTFATTAEAAEDVSAAVNFILKRRHADRLNLIGWSWGTAIMGAYATGHGNRVNRLVLYAPLWYLKSPPPVSGSGAYRTVTRAAARQRCARGIPPDRLEEISPTAWFDAWWAKCLASDAAGAQNNPPVLRAPNGVVRDIDTCWARGKATWDPHEIRVPTLVVGGEWDVDTPPYMAEQVFAALTHAPCKCRVVVGEATHMLALEKHRLQLIRAVQHFLDDAT